MRPGAGECRPAVGMGVGWDFHSRFAFRRAWRDTRPSSVARLTSLTRLGSAPCSNKSEATATCAACPSCAARWRGPYPSPSYQGLAVRSMTVSCSSHMQRPRRPTGFPCVPTRSFLSFFTSARQRTRSCRLTPAPRSRSSAAMSRNPW